jgi:hypothetical protein
MASERTRKRFESFLSHSLLLLFSIPIIIFASDCKSNRVLFRSQQPEGLSYKSYDPYTLFVVEGPVQWRDLSLGRTAEIQVNKGDINGYGHFVEIDITQGNALSEVVWARRALQ